MTKKTEASNFAHVLCLTLGSIGVAAETCTGDGLYMGLHLNLNIWNRAPQAYVPCTDLTTSEKVLPLQHLVLKVLQK